jgi:hypothetical protein
VEVVGGVLVTVTVIVPTVDSIPSKTVYERVHVPMDAGGVNVAVVARLTQLTDPQDAPPTAVKEIGSEFASEAPPAAKLITT